MFLLRQRSVEPIGDALLESPNCFVETFIYLGATSGSAIWRRVQETRQNGWVYWNQSRGSKVYGNPLYTKRIL